jgi:cytoskeletal protein RodZ
MSIGESLAEARRQAGLSISQVSQRTRVREVIIGGIERDDYSACGGDFYARGHIRGIARAVGADPEPLIREYDATVRSQQPVPVADLFRPVTPIKVREPRRSNWSAILGLALVIVVGLAVYLVISNMRHASRARPAAALETGPAVHRHVAHARPRPPAKPTPAVLPYASQVVIHLTATQDCWVEFTTAGGGYLSQSYVVGGTSKSWTFGYPVDMRLGNPGGISLTVDGKNPLPPGTVNPITLSLGLNGSISS